jgi:hypothetical protein
VRHWSHNTDPRLRRLERALAESPNDVELQHAFMIAKVHAGELPELAAERLIPGRPVQPWQWVPASYVLLEAVRIGREAEWQQGMVGIRWMGPEEVLPSWGLDSGLELIGHPGGQANYFSPLDYTRVYVGARSTGWRELQGIADATFGELHDVQSPEYFRHVLNVIPPRWIPGLTDVEGWGIPRSLGGPRIAYADKLAPEQSSKIGSPDDYDGRMPDAHDPQMLLFASQRVVRSGRRVRTFVPPSGRARGHWRRSPGERSLQQAGPLLDVRLIDRVRIMERRGRKWSSRGRKWV